MRQFHIILLFAAVTMLFFAPVFTQGGNWGDYDWDQHSFYNGAALKSILHYHQIPLWNPYYCGGNPLLANPQSAFLSPFFLFILLFGTVAGLKVQAMVYFFLGLMGTYYVARRLECTAQASVAASFIFMMSSWFAARFVAGHTTFFPFALLPWVFFFFLKALVEARYALLSAAVLALMFLSGGIYPLYAAVVLLSLYAGLHAVSEKKLRAVSIIAAILLLAGLFAAVKVLPVLEFTAGVGTEKDAQFLSTGILAKAFFSPSQALEQGNYASGRAAVPEGETKELATLAGKIPWAWHEYSAYIGILSFLLALGALLRWKRNKILILSALFFFLLLLGDSSPVWSLLRSLPFFSSLHGPSRFAIPFVFILSLLAARTLSSVRPLNKPKISAAIAVIIALELLVVSFPLMASAFPREPVQNLQLDNDVYIQLWSSIPAISQYPNMLQNIGTVNCYERLHLQRRALPQFVDGAPYEGFMGDAYIADTNTTLPLATFSPNKVGVTVEGVNNSATIVLNQNYYPGWTASTGRTHSFKGLIAADVSAAETSVTFSYRSDAFIKGLLISLLTIFGASFVFVHHAKVRRLLFKKQV